MIIVLYHSGYGHTQRMAQAVADGANADMIAIDAEGNLPEGAWDKLLAAHAIIFGSPTYMGSVSWQFKKFADASSKPWYAGHWKDKIAAGFTTASGPDGDKQGTLSALFTLAMQHGMIWVSQGIMPNNTNTAQRNDINHLASYSGATAYSPGDSGARDMAPGDLETARLFGARVASVAALFQR